jgi:hypothetical protein
MRMNMKNDKFLIKIMFSYLTFATLMVLNNQSFLLLTITHPSLKTTFQLFQSKYQHFQQA